MADLGMFDASAEPELAPRGDFSALPPGVYTVMVVSTERKKSSSSNNSYLNVRFDVVDGQFKKRVLWHMFFLWYDKPGVVAQARSELGFLGRACGKSVIAQSEELHNKICKVLVKVKMKDGKEENAIENFYSAGIPDSEILAKKGGTSPKSAQAAPAPAAEPQATSGTKAPWAK